MEYLESFYLNFHIMMCVILYTNVYSIIIENARFCIYNIYVSCYLYMFRGPGGSVS